MNYLEEFKKMEEFSLSKEGDSPLSVAPPTQIYEGKVLNRCATTSLLEVNGKVGYVDNKEFKEVESGIEMKLWVFNQHFKTDKNEI